MKKDPKIERLHQDLLVLTEYLAAVEFPDLCFLQVQAELFLVHIGEATKSSALAA